MIFDCAFLQYSRVEDGNQVWNKRRGAIQQKLWKQWRQVCSSSVRIWPVREDDALWLTKRQNALASPHLGVATVNSWLRDIFCFAAWEIIYSGCSRAWSKSQMNFLSRPSVTKRYNLSMSAAFPKILMTLVNFFTLLVNTRLRLTESLRCLKK